MYLPRNETLSGGKWKAWKVGKSQSQLHKEGVGNWSDAPAYVCTTSFKVCKSIKHKAYQKYVRNRSSASAPPTEIWCCCQLPRRLLYSPVNINSKHHSPIISPSHPLKTPTANANAYQSVSCFTTKTKSEGLMKRFLPLWAIVLVWACIC